MTQNLCAQYYFHKQWDFRYGGTGGEGLGVIKHTIDDGYILGGNSNSNITGDKTEASRGGYDYWVVKIDSVGNKKWDRCFGGSGQEGFSTIMQTHDNGYLLGGNSSSNISGDKTQANQGGDDYWIVKIDINGNKQWDKRFGGTLSEMSTSIIETKDGGYLLGGYSNSGISGDKTQENWDNTHFFDDGWIVMLDSLGNKLWDKKYGGTDQDGVNSILTLNDGYLLGCYSASDSNGDKSQPSWGHQIPAYWIVKIDFQGNKIWDKKFGGTGGEYFAAFAKTIDGGYILAGQSASDSGGDKTVNRINNSWDYWIVKIDSLGNKKWDKNFGGNGADELQSITQTVDAGYLLSGRSESNISGNKTEDNLGLYQVWIVKTDSNGVKQWDKTIFTGGYDGGYAIQIADGCYLTGVSTNSNIAGYKTQTNWDNTNQTRDYWILKFCMDTVVGVGIGDEVTSDEGRIQIQVYPNPFSSDLSIALKGENIHEATFTITNAMGQLIYKREESNLSSNYTKVLDLAPLPSEFYFVAVTINGETTAKRVVKQ